MSEGISTGGTNGAGAGRSTVATGRGGDVRCSVAIQVTAVIATASVITADLAMGPGVRWRGACLLVISYSDYYGQLSLRRVHGSREHAGPFRVWGALMRKHLMGRLKAVKDSTLDPVDRQIVHALTVQPRASFRTLAEVTGTSDQTAARRYRGLVRSAGLRVLAVVNGSRAGWVDWHVRLQTTPGSADALAAALARRPDTRWVRLHSGGTEIVCVLQARTPEERDALLLTGLPGSRRVVQISAHCVLKDLAATAWSGLTQALSAEQLAMLRPTVIEPASAGRLEPSDEPLLAELAKDARTSLGALAAAVGWHESTVRRRIGELESAGLLYFDVDVDERLYGVNLAAMLWLTVEPAHLEAVAQVIATHPEMPFVGVTTGAANLVASGLFRDTQHLYDYITGPLAGLDGIRSVESAPVIRTLKRSGAIRPRWASP